MALCECGCGKIANSGRRFISGHNRRGITVSDKTREKISIGLIKHFEENPVSDIIREKLSEAGIKRFEDPLEREKVRETTIKQWGDPIAREKLVCATNKRWKDPIKREKLIESQIKGWDDPKVRENAKESALQYINNNPEQAKINKVNGGIASCKAQNGKQSSIELKIIKLLIDNNYNFETQVPLYNMCIPDIVFKNEKVIIQCDGDYWHDYPNGLEKDHKQDKILKANGWQVMRFWEHEINNDIDDCLERFEWETVRRFHD